MTQTVAFAEITIAANRQRKDFDPEALTDLANSISARGLLHPIVLRESDTGDFHLVAGERRLRAMEQIWMLGDGVRHNSASFEPYRVPFVTLGDLSPLEAEEAELDENLKRRDLTWQERAEALARLHELRVKQATEMGETHTFQDTWEEGRKGGFVSSNPETVRASIILAEHLDNPLVARAKDPKEALKAIRREEERLKSIALSERVGETYNSSAHTLANIDCIEWFKQCPDNTFDVILTDPPYGMNAQLFGDGGGKLVNSAHHYRDDLRSWSALMGSVCPEFYRVAKPQAHAYVFCDFDQFHALKSHMEKVGWYVFRTPIIVYKLGSGRVPRPEHGPRRQWEMCLYAIKGDKPVTGIFSDVVPCKLEENLSHGANKPVELFVDLLRRSVRPGDSVLDAFAGTGTIFPAAHQCKVYATGLEISPEYYGICVNRLNLLDEEPSMI